MSDFLILLVTIGALLSMVLFVVIGLAIIDFALNLYNGYEEEDE